MSLSSALRWTLWWSRARHSVIRSSRVGCTVAGSMVRENGSQGPGMRRSTTVPALNIGSLPSPESLQSYVDAGSGDSESVVPRRVFSGDQVPVVSFVEEHSVKLFNYPSTSGANALALRQCNRGEPAWEVPSKKSTNTFRRRLCSRLNCGNGCKN